MNIALGALDIPPYVLWGGGVVLVIVLTLFFMKLKKNQDEIRKIITDTFPEHEIRMHAPHAYHMARQSHGYGQSRGNGNLILTDKELFFAMAFPKTIYSIPLESIGEIETPRRMNGRSIMRRMLKVNFKTENGEDEAVGWIVQDLDTWVAEITMRKGKRNS